MRYKSLYHSLPEHSALVETYIKKFNVDDVLLDGVLVEMHTAITEWFAANNVSCDAIRLEVYSCGMPDLLNAKLFLYPNVNIEDVEVMISIESKLFREVFEPRWDKLHGLIILSLEDSLIKTTR